MAGRVSWPGDVADVFDAVEAEEFHGVVGFDEAAGYFLVEYMDPVFIVHEKPMPMRGGALHWKLRERWDGWWR